MIYLDTGCLLKLYYPEPDSAAVARLVSGKIIAFSSLHELEMTNALHLKAFRKEARATQVRPHFHGPTMAAFRNRPRAEHALLLRRA